MTLDDLRRFADECDRRHWPDTAAEMREAADAWEAAVDEAAVNARALQMACDGMCDECAGHRLTELLPAHFVAEAREAIAAEKGASR